MLEIDDIMLYQRIVLNLHHMQHELPRHRVLCHFGKIHEMSHTFIGQRFSAVCLNGNDVGIVCHDGLLVEAGLWVTNKLLLLGGVTPIFSKVRKPLLYVFSSLTGESKGMGIPIRSYDLKGSTLKMSISERFLVTSTVNAPLFPPDGLMVPERKVSESTCLKMTVSPKQTCCFYLLHVREVTFWFGG